MSQTGRRAVRLIERELRRAERARLVFEKLESAMLDAIAGLKELDAERDVDLAKMEEWVDADGTYFPDTLEWPSFETLGIEAALVDLQDEAKAWPELLESADSERQHASEALTYDEYERAKAEDDD